MADRLLLSVTLLCLAEQRISPNAETKVHFIWLNCSFLLIYSIWLLLPRQKTRLFVLFVGFGCIWCIFVVRKSSAFAHDIKDQICSLCKREPSVSPKNEIKFKNQMQLQTHRTFEEFFNFENFFFCLNVCAPASQKCCKTKTFYHTNKRKELITAKKKEVKIQSVNVWLLCVSDGHI